MTGLLMREFGKSFQAVSDVRSWSSNPGVEVLKVAMHLT